MKPAALTAIVLFGACAWAACDDSTEAPPTCPPEQQDPCVVPSDGGAPPDGAPPSTNDGSIVDPIPFDAGTNPAPTCKGLFELCSGQECCSPYLCTNGTCR